MKTLYLLLFGGVMLSVVTTHAQNGPPAHDRRQAQGLHAALNSSDDLAALDHFLSMSDSELDQLQQAVARVRAMTPAERDALRQKIIAYRQLPEAERQQVQQGWGWQSAQDRDDWRQMMHSKTDPERSAIQADVQSAPPEQRAARKHSILEEWRTTSNRP